MACACVELLQRVVQEIMAWTHVMLQIMCACVAAQPLAQEVLHIVLLDHVVPLSLVSIDLMTI